MAHKNSGTKSISVDERAIAISRTERLDALDRKLRLVAAGLGKNKSEVVADALEAWLDAKWAEIMKTYVENRG